MSAATVTSKGQITIPANVRQALQVEAGDRVQFLEVELGRFEVVLFACQQGRIPRAALVLQSRELSHCAAPSAVA